MLIRLTGIHCRERTQTRMRSRALERLAVLPPPERAHVYSQKQTETKSGHPSLNPIRSLSVFCFFYVLYVCSSGRTHVCVCVCVCCEEGERTADAADFPRKQERGRGE